MKTLSRILNLIVVPLFLMSLIIIGTTVPARAEIIYELEFSPEDLAVHERQGFHVVELPDCIPSRDVGRPQLPLKVLQFAVDINKDIHGIEIIEDEKVEIEGAFDIYPAQAACRMDQECSFTEPDPQIYGSDQSYPAKRAMVAERGMLGGTDIATVHVYPLEYIPQETYPPYQDSVQDHAALRDQFGYSIPSTKAAGANRHFEQITKK